MGFVARVDIGGVRACSAALVAPEWVITAASCFAVNGQPVTTGASALPTTVSVGGVHPSVVRIVPHPSRDAVLAMLSLRVGVAPVAVSGTAPATGDSLQVAGYGRTGTGWVPGQASAAAASAGAVGADSFSWTAPEASACRGDSGGPVVRTGGAQPDLVGIASGSGQGGCLGEPDTRYGGTSTRVDDLKTWITENTPSLLTTFRSYFDSSSGIGGYNFASAADQVVPFDYEHSGKLDHLVLYRPGAGTVWILRHAANGTYTAVYHSDAGIGGYDLRSAADRIVAFDYEHSGKLDHLVLYRPGESTVSIVEHGVGAAFTQVYSNVSSGIAGYNLADVRWPSGTRRGSAGTGLDGPAGAGFVPGGRLAAGVPDRPAGARRPDDVLRRRAAAGSGAARPRHRHRGGAGDLCGLRLASAVPDGPADAGQPDHGGRWTGGAGCGAAGPGRGNPGGADPVHRGGLGGGRGARPGDADDDRPGRGGRGGGGAGGDGCRAA